MSDNFLIRFLHVAYQVTQADRGIAVDAHEDIKELIHVSDVDLEDPSFSDFARAQLKRGIADGETIITNNIITDPTQAPKTNTALSNLRFVVVIPVKEFGAVYLDRLIRHGIITRDIIDKLKQVIRMVPAASVESITEDQMLEMFSKLP